MYPGHEFQVELGIIHNGGGILEGPMLQMPWGDKVLLGKAFLKFPDGTRKHRLCLPGTILRPNRERERRTNGASTHEICVDAYAAERGAKHAVVNYGARAKGKHTEVADLKSTVQTLREYVVFLLAQGPHFEHVLKDLYLGMDKLAGEYSWKIDDKKKQAAIDMIRGLLEHDSLGRKNYPAAAMAMGGAIWNLLEREEAVQWLDMHMDQRAIQTERLIAAHIDLYQQLWDLVGKETAIRELVNSSDHQCCKLRAIHKQLEAVCLRPFIKNAMHTVRDIEDVLDPLPGRQLDQDLQSREDVLMRLKEGIRWVFVLDALQRGIIFPLSFLIDQLLREERTKRKRSGKKKSNKYEAIPSKMAEDKFADLQDRIATFRGKLDKCDDSALAHPVKDEVLSLLDYAEGHMTVDDDWRKVKRDLDAIAEIL